MQSPLQFQPDVRFNHLFPFSQIETELFDTLVWSGWRVAWPEMVRFSPGLGVVLSRFREMVMFWM